MQKILVTGATGFIGANICRYFYDIGFQVFAVTGPSKESWRLDDICETNKKFIDITNKEDVHEYLKEVQPEYIVNCAAYGAYSNQTNQDKIYNTNFNSVKNLLSGCLNISSLKAFVQMGSSSEYGINCTAPRETDSTWPDSDYAVSKVSASAVTRFYNVKYGLPTFVFRLYSVYGPLEDMSRLVPQILLKAQTGHIPPLVNPNISRDFIYIDDVCKALEILFRSTDSLKGGDFYNIGTGICTTIKDIVDVSSVLFNINEKPAWGSMPAREWDHNKWYANIDYLKEQFLWKPEVSLRDGLLKNMQWFNDNEELIKTAILKKVR